MAKVALTVEAIAEARQAGKEAVLRDTKAPGLEIRIRASGAAAFSLRYRVGRDQLRVTIGSADALTITQARAEARRLLGRLAAGGDPQHEKKIEARRRDATLAAAVAAYALALEKRHVVNRAWYLSTLERHLVTPLRPVTPVSDISRADILQLVERLETAGKPGAARELRQRASAFFAWLATTGRIDASPLAGFRRERATRAERLKRPGRALDNHEIRAVWQAAEACGYPFGLYVQVLLLCGQRRSETAAMLWEHVDLDAGTWRIPALNTKMAKELVVPLPALAIDILKRCPRLADNEHVFAGRIAGTAMSGFAKRTASLVEAAGVEAFTLHDCRRSFRTGLARLAVAYDVAERMVGHAPRSELAAIYDRADLWPQRVEAAHRWATHIAGLLADKSNVTAIRRRRLAR